MAGPVTQGQVWSVAQWNAFFAAPPTVSLTDQAAFEAACTTYGVAFDGVTDDAVALQNAINSLAPDGLYRSQQRFGMYRWHLPDPIHFHADLRVDIQALGWKSRHRYQPLRDDIASTAFLLSAGLLGISSRKMIWASASSSPTGRLT